MGHSVSFLWLSYHFGLVTYILRDKTFSFYSANNFERLLCIKHHTSHRKYNNAEDIIGPAPNLVEKRDLWADELWYNEVYAINGNKELCWSHKEADELCLRQLGKASPKSKCEFSRWKSQRKGILASSQITLTWKYLMILWEERDVWWLTCQVVGWAGNGGRKEVQKEMSGKEDQEESWDWVELQSVLYVRLWCIIISPLRVVGSQQISEGWKKRD